MGFERADDVWVPVDNPVVPSEDQISGDYASLFRASMIVGIGFERRIAGTTALMVGMTYNNSLFSTHKDQTVVKVDASGVPRFAENGVFWSNVMRRRATVPLRYDRGWFYSF